MTIEYRLLPGGYVDATGPHRGVPPSQQDTAILDLLMLHRRMMFGPYDLVISTEMPIEEAKRRWPNTPIGQPQPEQTQTVHSAPNESDTDSGKSME